MMLIGVDGCKMVARFSSNYHLSSLGITRMRQIKGPHIVTATDRLTRRHAVAASLSICAGCVGCATWRQREW